MYSQCVFAVIRKTVLDLGLVFSMSLKTLGDFIYEMREIECGKEWPSSNF